MRMQTVETLNEGLKRAYTLTITAAEVDAKVDAEVKRVAPPSPASGRSDVPEQCGGVYMQAFDPLPCSDPHPLSRALPRLRGRCPKRGWRRRLTRAGGPSCPP